MKRPKRKTLCKEGHPLTRDKKGRPRCLACDRARYRKAHPYNRQQRLALAAHLAPRLRSQSEDAIRRRVALTDKDGNVTGHTTLRKVQEALLHRHDLAFDVGDGVRPIRTSCVHCGAAFVANTQGAVALVCLEGCDRACVGCGELVTVKSARAFAKQGRKPVCRACADRRRPKVERCKRGHEFTPANTLVSEKTRQRFCRACKRERMRKHRSARKAAAELTQKATRRVTLSASAKRRASYSCVLGHKSTS